MVPAPLSDWIGIQAAGRLAAWRRFCRAVAFAVERMVDRWRAWPHP